SGVLPPATATRYATLGAHVTLDRRDVRYTREFGTRYVPSGDDLTDRPLNPDHGTLLSLDYLRFRELSDVDASFSQLRLEAQQYVSFFNGYHTFALRHRSTFTDPDVGEVVPFYWLPYAGGNFTVRGYDEFRFQGGRHGVLYNLEYRYKVWHHADVVLFGDAGKVFDSIEEWGVTNLRYSYGAEIRFTTPRTTLFRVGVAFDENHSSRLVFEFSNVF
ncbi:MAG: BamA/TamA family outer membrane protein, partial [Salinibacter sp.]